MKFNKLIPELCVSDIKRSIYFYSEILGFKVEYQRKESKFAFVSYHGAQLMLEENPNSRWKTGKMAYPFGRGVNLQIEAKDISRMVQSLKKSKYPVKMMPKENWYRQDDKLLGLLEFLVLDPDGYLLRFSQKIGSKPA